MSNSLTPFFYVGASGSDRITESVNPKTPEAHQAAGVLSHKRSIGSPTGLKMGSLAMRFPV